MAEVRAGARLKCETCGSEAIVTKSGGPELTCCGAPLVPAAGGAKS